jgi:hypothetical protein
MALAYSSGAAAFRDYRGEKRAARRAVPALPASESLVGQVPLLPCAGIPVTKGLLMLGPDGRPIENPAAAAVAAKAGPSSSAPGTLQARLGAPRRASERIRGQRTRWLTRSLKSNRTIIRSYKWGSSALKKAMSEGVVRTRADGRLYRRPVAGGHQCRALAELGAENSRMSEYRGAVK